jgi:AmpD protein
MSGCKFAPTRGFELSVGEVLYLAFVTIIIFLNPLASWLCICLYLYNKSIMKIDLNGVVNNISQRACTHFDERPVGVDISLLVIHNISLPAGQFGTPFVDDLFMGTLNCNAHTSFVDLQGVRVSAHCFIKRTGELIQYVPFAKRAWHAGQSEFAGQTACNNFSIGIELEGTDTAPYTQAQYTMLAVVSRSIMQRYPKITPSRIVGHCDIAPGRKTDPGNRFNWQLFLTMLEQTR